MDNILIFVQAPSLILQMAIDGILIGAVFALAAYGMSLVWGVMKIINIAQGEFVMLGGYVTYYLAQVGVHPLYFGIPLSALALYFVGWGVYRVAIFRVVDRDLFISLLAAFGLSILFQQLFNTIFGADVVSADSGLDSLVLFDGMIVVAEIKLVAFFMTIVVGAGVFLFMKKTRMGRAIRATAQNPRAARVMGVNTDKVYAHTYAINAALCGAAGSLVALTWFLHPFAGLPYTIRSFMIVVVAGLGNIAGVVFSALGLGAAENFAGFILGAEFQIAFVFGLLVVILLYRNFMLGRKRAYLE